MRVALKLSLMISMVIITACTQEKAFKEVDNKKHDINAGSIKADIIVDDSVVASGVDHMMMVSNVGGDMNSPAIAFEIGDPMKVRLVMEKEGALSVYKIPRNDTGNIQNRKLIVSIPIENIDYKCSEDAFGKCTNSEEIDNEKLWYEKKFFKPKFESAETNAVVGMSIDYMNFSRNCFTEQSSKLVTYKLEEGALNFILEKSYKTSASCLSTIKAREFTDLNFSVRQHYSIVESQLLKSPNYVKKPYQLVPTESGSVEFGFFKTIIDKLDPSNRRLQGQTEQLINRWDPSKTSVTYYLSPAFEKPENKAIKEATVHAVKVINNSLEKAQAKLRIDLKSSDSTKMIGDIRNNYIIMVEDPISRGLLGYGPSITDPDTGEILSARTVMYKGIMKMTVRSAYNDIVEMAKKNVQAEKNKGLLVALSNEGSNGNSSRALPLDMFKSLLSTNPSAVTINPTDEQTSMQYKNNVLEAVKIKRPLDDLFLDRSLDASKASVFSKILHSTLTPDELLLEQDYLTAKNFYPTGLVNFHGDVEKKLQLIAQKFQLRSWSHLALKEQEEIINTLLPVLWVPTLVHELGHNLGLRHNFSGSVDKNNFYTLPELGEMNIERPIDYSSIMDYAFGTTNELPIMGKYDIAAMSFAYGYATVTEVVDGKSTNVEYNGLVQFTKNVTNDEGSLVVLTEYAPLQNPAEAQKLISQGYSVRNYEFCTDEHVSLNPNCNRFDEGTNLIEIAKHYTKSYEDNYKRLNLRNARESFDNISGSVGYIMYIERMFRNMRLNFERYETISNIPDYSPEKSVWNENAFLIELKQAAILSGQFFLDVLKTPDALCRISAASAPAESLGLYPLASFGDSFAHCGQLELVPGYVITGQAGKSFKDRRYYKNPSAYVGEIDARGVWVDKLLAAKYLFGRQMSFLPNDKNYQNYLSLPELKGEILLTTSELMKDQLFANVTVKTDPVFTSHPSLSLGEDILMQWSFTLNQNNSHQLEVPLHPGVQRYFKIGNEPVSYQQQLVQLVKSYNDSNHFEEMDQMIDAMLGVAVKSADKFLDTTGFTTKFAQCFGYESVAINCVTEASSDAPERAPTGATPVEVTEPELPEVIADVVFFAKPNNSVANMAMIFATQVPEAAAAITNFTSDAPQDVKDRGAEAINEWVAQRRARLFELIKIAFGMVENPGDLPADESNLLNYQADILYGLYTGNINDGVYYERLLSSLAE